MLQLRSGVILAVLGGLTAGTAQAADLYEPDVVEAPAPVQTYVEPAPEVGTSWYIRGDVGYSINDLRGAYFLQGTAGGAPGYNNFTTANLDNSWLVGGGIGVNISRHLRADITLDYMTKAKFKGSTTGTCGGVPCTSSDTSGLSALVVLANAYVDVGTWHGITGYVGGGIGGAHVKWDDLINVAPTGTVRHTGYSSARFAYALTAGASYCLTNNLELDASYRYTRISSGDMFLYKTGGGPGYDRGLSSHAVRAGLRYSFGGSGNSPRCAPEPEVVSYQPEPMPVYK
ncbi:porin [Zhengella mangrovi]|uniref:Porin n=1 Tax=Zhengella mangrovi TaxID=1982044 RepID=A0A2G1QKU5_9HYPH|nr:outer membrane protein [Zhengella mangrovi]PHP66146.1 porin [Zhengella mangrovi]